jgi:23S rRNA pseudouridine2605 synthase
VAKVLARAGVASRRDIERLIGEGKVALNGEVLTSPAVKVGPRDVLTVDGQAVSAAEATRLFRYHKPAGLMTTHRDPKGRATVFEALPSGLPRLISVGRLDLTSEGLLLLTNDGGLARALELPSSGWKRRYRARAFGRIDQKRLDALKDGLTVEGVHYGPIEATLDKVRESAGGGSSGANIWITLVLGEGKNREVRRVLEALGLKVNRLIRLAYGPFALGPLAPGAVEEVGPRVIREQLGELIAPASLPRGDRPLWRAPENAVAAKAPSRRAPKPAEPPKRKVYKAGWAKAKPPRR